MALLARDGLFVYCVVVQCFVVFENSRIVVKGKKNMAKSLWDIPDFITFAVANISLAKRCGGCAVDFCAVDSHFSPASLGWAGTLQQFYKRQVFRWNGRFCGSHAYR